MRLEEINRDEILAIVEDARAKAKGKRQHVRTILESRYPEIVGMTVRRNTHVYNALDYLLGDVESYGSKP